MHRIITLVAATLAGAVIATQAPTNTALGRSIGDLRAVVVNFAVGGIAIAVIALVLGGGLGGLSGDPVRWHYLGGLAGALFVTIAVLTVRPLGVTLQTAAIIVGQLTAAAVIDHFGFLDMQTRPLTATHAVGIGLLAAGVAVLARA
ncbi:MAG TPA: DMT family transporter [Gaiellales bacterium]|jgi:transporter family-2 protein|nr:DMT family transporter [Gaiellales bacterium]